MRTIFAEYNPHRNSIDVYTSAGYMLRIDCWEAEKNLKTTPGSDYALNTLLTLLPQRIEIHLLDSEDEFIKTVKLIFEDRVYICRECNICRTYKMIKMTKQQ